MQFSYPIQTKQKNQMLDITVIVKQAIEKSNIRDGLCLVYCPHTTAAITINENADPDVTKDILNGLNKALPDLAEFRHLEGNSDAHIKSSVIGTSEMLIITEGKPVLGTWQGIYFCEFDGPRQRKFFVKILA